MKQDQSVEVSEAVESTAERPLYEALLEGGVSASLAYEATQGVRNLAGISTTARLLAAIKAQGAELNAKIKALDTKIEALKTKFEAGTGALRWMMGIVIALLAALIVLVTLTLRELSRIPGGGAAVAQAVAAPGGTSTSEPAGASAPDEAASPMP